MKKTYKQAMEEVGKIIKIPDPILLWTDSKDKNCSFYGYKDSNKGCYGCWFIPGDTFRGSLDKVIENAIIEIKRHLLWGSDTLVKNDSFGSIVINKDQFKKIRELGKNIL